MSDPAASRPAKRIKVEENVAKPAYTRSDVWFDDGNIVLEAGAVLFRVHKSVLGARSTVLRDRFSAEDIFGETIDRCCLVHLSDDPRELKYVLKVLYGEVSYFMPDIQMEWVVVSAFVNLGTKYQIPLLRDEAVARLSGDCPTTLHALDLRTWRIADRYAVDADIVNLARQHKLASLLPVALYYTAALEAHEIITPIRRIGGAVTALSHNDQVSCLRLRERILAHQVKYRFGWLETQGTHCVDRKRCQSVHHRIGKNICNYALQITALAPWPPPWEDVSLCQSCADAAAAKYEQYRVDFWEKLPGLCGLGPWAELTAGGA